MRGSPPDHWRTGHLREDDQANRFWWIPITKNTHNLQATYRHTIPQKSLENIFLINITVILLTFICCSNTYIRLKSVNRWHSECSSSVRRFVLILTSDGQFAIDLTILGQIIKTLSIWHSHWEDEINSKLVIWGQMTSLMTIWPSQTIWEHVAKKSLMLLKIMSDDQRRTNIVVSGIFGF